MFPSLEFVYVIVGDRMSSAAIERAAMSFDAASVALLLLTRSLFGSVDAVRVLDHLDERRRRGLRVVSVVAGEVGWQHVPWLIETEPLEAPSFEGPRSDAEIRELAANVGQRLEIELERVARTPPTRQRRVFIEGFVEPSSRVATLQPAVDALRRMWSEHGGVVCVLGRSGTGKSRVLRQWVRDVVHDPDLASDGVFWWSFEQRPDGFLDAMSNWLGAYPAAAVLNRERRLIVLDHIHAIGLEVGWREVHDLLAAVDPKGPSLVVLASEDRLRELDEVTVVRYLELGDPPQKDASAQEAKTEPPQLDEAAFLAALGASGRRTLALADGLRTAMEVREIHMEHLIGALFDAGDASTRGAWAQSGLKDDDVRTILGHASGRVWFPRSQYRATAFTELPRQSAHAREALARAFAAATAQGAQVAPRHLLYGALRVKCGLVETLRGQKLSADLVSLDSIAGDTAAPAIAGYRSDDPEGRDMLSISREVDALCYVLAAKDVEPPVSLGLFGEWGSGKSFFMRKMEARIDGLTDKARKRKGASAYCENIIQIRFNAWHYIDTNLWASLTAEIFEGLGRKLAQEKEQPEGARERLLAAAASTKDVLADAERSKTAAEEELRDSKERLEKLAADQAAVNSALSARTMVREVSRFVAAQPDIARELTRAAETLQIPAAQRALSEVNAHLVELQGLWGQARAIGLAARNSGPRLWIVSAVCVALAALLLGLRHYVDLPGVGAWVARMTALLVAAGPPLKMVIGRARKAISIIDAARTAQADLIKKAESDARKELEARQARLATAVEEARARVGSADKQLKEITQKLDELRADRQMLDFIRRRRESSDYRQHLGVIASARRDFEELSRLLASSRREASEDGARSDEPPLSEADRARLPRVDRIVLYIDDLDRCPEDKVVHVLQAVHLLLAFPLFVVVVGVDPRWLLHSLRQYSRALRAGAGEIPGEDARQWESTPLNYLEKIFQIPFTLRPMRSRGFGRLIESLTVTTEPEPRPAPSTEPPPGPTAPPSPPGPTVTPPAPVTASPGGAVHPGTPTPPTPPPPSPSAVATPQPAADAIDANPEHLKIESWERAFMKQFHRLMPSPRAAKRFVNIYRLLRASVPTERRAEFLGTAEQPGDHRAVLALLAAVVGYPREASELLQALVEADRYQEWAAFLRSVRGRAATLGTPEGGDGDAGFSAERWDELIAELERLASSLAPNAAAATFIDWAERVARYSFYSGRLVFAQAEDED